MALQASGAISLSDIQTELGGASPISLSEYYRGGAYTSSANTSVPTSGAISVSNLYGAENVFELVYSNISSSSTFAAPASATSDTITIAWSGAYAQTGTIQDPLVTGAGFVAVDDVSWEKTQSEDTANGRGHISWFNGAAAGKNPFTSVTIAGGAKHYGMSVWRKPAAVTATSGTFWKADDNLDDTATRWGTSGQTLAILWATMLPTATPGSSPCNLTTCTFAGASPDLIQNPTGWGMACKILDTSVAPSPFINSNNVSSVVNWRTSYIKV